MPQGHIPLALLFFNLRIEVGQLLFVAAALVVIALMRGIRVPLPRWAELASPYAMALSTASRCWRADGGGEIISCHLEQFDRLAGPVNWKQSAP